MPTYLSPGVYVEEIPAATAPISGVGTAIAGFAGFAPMGPFNAPTMVTNWQQYVSAFGEFTEEFALAKAVYGFFNNGGGRAYIVRLPYPGDGDAPSPALPVAALPTSDAKGAPAITFRALDANAGEITVQTTAPSGDKPAPGSFDISVSVAGTLTENYTGATLAQGQQMLPPW